MGEFVLQLYLGMAQLFAGLFPERFQVAARTGPTWRRIAFAFFIGLGSVAVGLIVAALALAALFLAIALVFGLVRALV